MGLLKIWPQAWQAGRSQEPCTFMQQVQRVSWVLGSPAAAGRVVHMLQLTPEHAHTDLRSLMHMFSFCAGQAALQVHSNRAACLQPRSCSDGRQAVPP